MQYIDNPISVITESIVPEEARLNTLPTLFGRHFLRVEQSIFQWMERLCPEYTGGYWHFYTLSNGGFFMALDTDSRVCIQVEGNGFHRAMSPMAAGVVVCLFAYSHLCFTTRSDEIASHYSALRDYAAQHTEAAKIFAAID